MRIARPSAAQWVRLAAWCGVAVPLVTLTLGTGCPSTTSHNVALLQPWLFSWLGGVALAAPPTSGAVIVHERRAPRAVVDLRTDSPPDLEGWFGIGLRCSDCTMSRADSSGVRVWRFRSAPEIMWIDPDSPAAKAGIEQGDALVKVAGMPITSSEAGRRFGAVKPGESMQWTLEKDGKQRTVTIVADERPDHDVVSADFERQLRHAREQMDEAKQELKLELRRRDTDRSDHDRQRMEEALQQLEATHRELERMMRENRSLRALELYDVPEPPAAPEPPAPPAAPEAVRPRQNMRYEANVGDWHLEVRSAGEVGVSENHDKSEIVIKTPESTIRIRKNH
jgi:hypothetical protein